MKTAPLFIALEGLDGAGTTTQGTLLAHWIESLGRRVHLTREPSTGPVGSLIREILRGHLGEFEPSALALLFAADRLDHLAREIRPSLARGHDVISDRYVWSSLSYQGVGGNLAWVRRLNERAQPPDMTVFLDVPPAVCLQRVAGRGAERELFERLDTLEAVHQVYLELLADRGPADDLVVVDGTLPIDDVTARIKQAMAARFGSPFSNTAVGG